MQEKQPPVVPCPASMDLDMHRAAPGHNQVEETVLAVARKEQPSGFKTRA